MSEYATATAQATRTRLNDHPGAILLDVRTPVEYEGVHAIGAENRPLDQLDADCCKALCAEWGERQEVYVICHSGARAQQAVARMAAAGIEHVTVVEGGTQAWESAGLPVVKGHTVMPMDQQVRLTAGSLVTLGAVLALTLHPLFVLLSLGVGCGLMYSGLSGTCAMATLLAKMPWNQLNTPSATAK